MTSDVTADFNPIKISSPRIFLFRMFVFLVIVGIAAYLMQAQVKLAFFANPLLNGVILGAAGIGVLITFRQVIRLFREVRYVNAFRISDPASTAAKPPVLLAPMAAILGMKRRALISTLTMRSLLDSLGARLDEGRDLSRYLTSLLVFLGLLGTFWGLIETVTSVGKVIGSLSAGGELGSVFEDMKKGLAQPLAGMGIAFSSSLFGLAGSLVLGFLDLQASQAQNRFYTEVEDFLATTARDLAVVDEDSEDGASLAGIARSVETLRASLTDGSSVSVKTATALAGLAEGIQGLVSHMRAEQQMVRSFIEEQASEREALRHALERIAPGAVVTDSPPPRPLPEGSFRMAGDNEVAPAPQAVAAHEPPKEV